MHDQPLDRNLGLDLVRATEAAAVAAGRWMGLGRRDEADDDAAAATAKEIKAACLTDLALAKPEATNRVGPTRLSSVPFMPSE